MLRVMLHEMLRPCSHVEWRMLRAILRAMLHRVSGPLVWGKSLTFYTWTRLCARANEAKIVRSRDAQCNTKDGEIRDKNPQLVAQHCFVAIFIDVSRFSPCVINLSHNKNICYGLKKVVAKRRARVYFERQILALLLVFHQTHNLSRNNFARALANQPISALHFFNPQQMFSLRVKLIMQGEKRETSTKTCNETILRDKLRVFVSRISPP